MTVCVCVCVQGCVEEDGGFVTFQPSFFSVLWHLYYLLLLGWKRAQNITMVTHAVVCKCISMHIHTTRH